MADRFLQCLAITLREETGYPQPVGGPYPRLVVTEQTNKNRARRGQPALLLGRYWLDGEQLRHESGKLIAIPAAPDDQFFSDDPHDTGGRTGAGILQREYDPWCRAQGLPARDVWRITDPELHTIYRAQYWAAVRADQLPPGLDLMVLDFGVVCGVGTAATRLQRALGVKADGHIGQVTLDALRNADPAELILKLQEARRRYHRGCKTFWRHGNNWLARTDRVTRDALAAASVDSTFAHVEAMALADTAPELNPVEPTGPRSVMPPEPDSMLGSSTGGASVAAGSGGLATMGNEIKQAAMSTAADGGPVTFWTVLGEVVSSPAFWAAVAIVGSAAYIWFERRRKMGLGQ